MTRRPDLGISPRGALSLGTPMRAAFFFASLAALLAPAAAAAAGPPPAEVRDHVAKYCERCHGVMKAKAGLRFDQIDFDIVGGKDGEHWQAIRDTLHKGEMPPEEERQPTSAERQAFLTWLDANLDEAARRKQGQSGSVLRRLTREQYTNTLRDLLGVPSDYTRLLPPESPSKMGMHNDGRVLASSTLHLEQTMKIARQALDRAMSIGQPPPAWRFRYVFGPQKTQLAKKVDLGYQSQPLDPYEYLVETFAGRSGVKTPTLSPKGEIRDRCYVDLRGSTDYDRKGGSAARYKVDERGLLLMPAKPHVEKEAQIWQGPNPNVALVLRDFPSEGPFVLRVTVERAQGKNAETAKATASGGDARPWLRAFVGNRQDDGMEYANFAEPRRVDAAPGKPQVIEFRGRLENFPVPVVDPDDKEFLSNLMVIGVWNDVLVPNAESTSPALVVKSIEFEGPVTDAWPSASHRRIFFDDRLKKDPDRYAREILRRFLGRAFRRPPTEAQLGRYFSFWKQQVTAGAGFEPAIRDTLAAALSSPSFLHHVEEGARRATAAAGGAPGTMLASTAPVAAPDRAAPGTAPEGRQPLDDFALANRLSYFLWNTMPDDQLLALAARGRLRSPRTLEAQTVRMLKDPRARDFFQTYAAQWLDLGAMDRVRVDVKQQPRFTRFVKEDMRHETSRTVEHLFRQNRPLGEIVDADYTLLNGNLAQFYGVPGVYGPEFRVVKIPPGQRRGGLIAQGSFLVGHSTGDDSHPIKRGVWLAKKILDDPPPPPPPNVPEIDRENPEIAKLSVKAQLELHRDREACRGCHAKLDPWGIPFEAFDAAGLPRKEIRKEVHGKTSTSAVDATAELPDGTRLEGLPALQGYLLGKRLDQIRESAARHLAAYALGRTPSFVDDKVMKAIAARAKARGDGMRELLLAVVESEAFQSK